MRTLLLYTLVATLPTNVQGQLGNRDWLDRIRDIIKDNIRPDDDEMQTLTPEAEVFGSDAPSWVPTLSPTISSTLGPSAAPSAVPSDTPSDVPSDSPSDVSSDVPSDIPSYLPSDFPSYLPSDMPSNTPSMEPSTISITPSPSKAPTEQIRRTAAPTPTFPDAVLESSLPEGFVPCRHGDSILEDTTGMRVLYLYRLRLEPNVELELATSIIESILSEAIQDTTCQNMVQVHAISTNPADTAVDECGTNCFIMVGSISLLLDSHTVTTTEDKSRLYCNTLTTVQDMMEFGGFDTIPGISSTENLQLQQDAELSANPYACLSSKIETITTNELTGVSIPKEFETDKSNTDEHHQSTYMYSFAGGMVMASGACLVVAMIVSRRRRQRLHFQRPPPLASPPSSFDFPVQQVVTERSIRSSAVSSLHDDEHPGAFVF